MDELPEAVRLMVCRLLADSSRRIHEVAEEVGYADVAHFSKSFKKYMGCTPGEYRNGAYENP